MSASNIVCKNITDNSSTESRYSLISWVNYTTGLHFMKVEQMCSGVAYCDMMYKLYPSCISNRRIKRDAKLEYEFISNFKLFQAALVTVGCTREVNIEQLVKGKFQANLEFLQWFRKFFDCNSLLSDYCEDAKGVASAGCSNLQPRPVQRGRVLGRAAGLSALQKKMKTLEKELVEMGEKVRGFMEQLRAFEIIQSGSDGNIVDSVVPSISGLL